MKLLPNLQSAGVLSPTTNSILELETGSKLGNAENSLSLSRTIWTDFRCFYSASNTRA